MGYRSQVVIGVSKELTETLPKWIKTDADESHPHEDYDLYIFDSIKWYDSYKDIQEFNEWMDNQDEEKYGVVIVGEELGDITHLGSPWEFSIYVTQSIAY